MVSQVERVEIVEPTALPPGEFKGRWSGYTVRLFDHPTIKIKTTTGLRGIDIACIVKVDKEGKPTVEIEE